MSYEDRGKAITMLAGADLTEARYVAVVKNAVDEQCVICAAGAAPDGIIQDGGRLNSAVPVLISGVSMVVAGAAVAAGAEVEVGADGAAITKDAGSVFGKALNAATAKGDIISILLKL